MNISLDFESHLRKLVEVRKSTSARSERWFGGKIRYFQNFSDYAEVQLGRKLADFGHKVLKMTGKGSFRGWEQNLVGIVAHFCKKLKKVLQFWPKK